MISVSNGVKNAYEGCKESQEHKLNLMTLDLNGHGLQH